MEAKHGGWVTDPIQRRRGQMAVLGLILLIGVVAIASIGILLVASQSTDDVKQQAETDRVEQSFIEMSKELETASSSQDVSRATDFSLDESSGTVTYLETGKISVTIGNTSEEEPVYEQSLGAIEYSTTEGPTIVYQAGGIWRDGDTGSQLVSSPNVHFRNDSLSLPVSVVNQSVNSGTAGSTLSLDQQSSHTVHTGPIGDQPVTINITTQYYEWWEDYFEVIVGPNNVDTVFGSSSDEQTVIVKLDAIEDVVEENDPDSPSWSVDFDPENAVEMSGSVDTGTGGETTGDIVGTDLLTIDHRVDGDVVSVGDIDVKGQRTVLGEVVSGEDITLGDGAYVEDIVVAHGDVEIRSGAEIEGSVLALGTVTAEDGATVHGDIVAGEDAVLGSIDRVEGDVISNGHVSLGGINSVDGDIVSMNGVSISSGEVYGDIITGGDLSMDSGTLFGDVHADGNINLENVEEVKGDIYATGDINIGGVKITGDLVSWSSIQLGDNFEIEGEIVSQDDLSMDGGSLHDDVHTYGDVSLDYGDVTGTVTATGTIDIPDESCSDGCERNADSDADAIERHPDEYSLIDPSALIAINPSEYTDTDPDDIPEREPLDNVIQSMIKYGEQEGEAFSVLSSGDTVESGTHYVDQIDVNPRGGPADTLEFDVEDGDVHVVVRGDIILDSNADIRVKNTDSGNTVHIYTDGSYSMQGGTSVCPVPAGQSCPDNDRDASVIQLYGTSSTDFSFGGNSRYHGVIYAPQDRNTADCTGCSDAHGSFHLFGSFVGGGFDGDGNVNFEHDENLDAYEPSDSQIPPTGEDDNGNKEEENGDTETGDDPVVEYLQITAHEVEVQTN